MEKQEFPFRIVIEVEYKGQTEEEARHGIEDYLLKALDGAYLSVAVPNISGRVLKVTNRRRVRSRQNTTVGLVCS